MKKSIFRLTSLFLSVALTAAFGFLTYFIVAASVRSDKELSDPLPEEGGSPSLPEPETPVPDTGGMPGTPPEALPPETDEDDAPSSEENVDKDEEKKHGSAYIRAKTNGLNVRSGPGTGYSSLGTLDKDDMLVYKGQSGGWYITEFRSRTAYISAGASYSELYEMEHDLDAAIEKVIAEGYKLLGHPYVYGAVRLHDGKGNFLKNFDATKYDCSSLMQYIYYYGANVILDVTTRTQVVQGKHVPKSDLQRGDLMFFTNSARYNKTGTERIGHVALYLGDNYILHTASDHAVIEPISAQRWKYYVESRRVA